MLWWNDRVIAPNVLTCHFSTVLSTITAKSTDKAIPFHSSAVYSILFHSSAVFYSIPVFHRPCFQDSHLVDSNLEEGNDQTRFILQEYLCFVDCPVPVLVIHSKTWSITFTAVCAFVEERNTIHRQVCFAVFRESEMQRSRLILSKSLQRSLRCRENSLFQVCFILYHSIKQLQELHLFM